MSSATPTDAEGTSTEDIATEDVPTEELLALGRSAGLAAVGVASAQVLQPARSVIQLRKAAGLAGEMQFTYRNPERSTDPGRVLDGARSIVAGAWGYAQWKNQQHPQDPTAVQTTPVGTVARYSWHDHYGDLEQALQPMADHLTSHGYKARIVADTNALVDRNVAWSAGLGWYGKNSNLLLPGVGSWFVLGAVVTDAELQPTGPPLDDGCGSCNQCIEDCPTDAIVAPGVVDARRCLAWIVQAGGPIPVEYRVAVGHRLYGCDDCQEVCPPNRSLDRTDPTEGPVADPARSQVELSWLLQADDEAILERHGRWYIADRNVDFIRRTALVVLGNVANPGDQLVETLLRRYLEHQLPLLRAHAVWASRRLGRDDLLSAVSTDPDPEVRMELTHSVQPRYSLSDWQAD